MTPNSEFAPSQTTIPGAEQALFLWEDHVALIERTDTFGGYRRYTESAIASAEQVYMLLSAEVARAELENPGNPYYVRHALYNPETHQCYLRDTISLKTVLDQELAQMEAGFVRFKAKLIPGQAIEREIDEDFLSKVEYLADRRREAEQRAEQRAEQLAALATP